MKYPHSSDPLCRALNTTILLLVALLALPASVRAECKELKIVEYEDRVEAVCVGEPLTEAQKKANMEEERRQEQEAQRQRAEQQKRDREDVAAASKARAEDERKRQSTLPPTPQKPVPTSAIIPKKL